MLHDPTLTTLLGALVAWAVTTRFLIKPMVTFDRHSRALLKTAEYEHSLGWVPHTDPDITKVCVQCSKDKG